MPGITIKTPEEIGKLKEGGRLLFEIVKKISEAVRPGITTLELDALARQLIAEAGARPSFEGFGRPPYPAALCTSVNEELVHCLPGQRVLKEGDIISLDCGIWHQGLCTDYAVTVPVGRISAEAEKLLKVTRHSLALAVRQVKEGVRLGDIGFAVQNFVEQNGFSVIRDLVGHGVGYRVHEPPRIANFGSKGKGEVLHAGMVLAIEPMVAVGNYQIKASNNGWNILTADNSLSAHFEQTVAVARKGAEILTQ